MQHAPPQLCNKAIPVGLWIRAVKAGAERTTALLEPKKPKPIKASAEDIARMEREMEKLYQDYRTVQDTLGDTMRFLVVAKGYVSRLLRNNAIMDYLRRYHADMTGELEKVMDAIKADAMSVERE